MNTENKIITKNSENEIIIAIKKWNDFINNKEDMYALIQSEYPNGILCSKEKMNTWMDNIPTTEFIHMYIGLSPKDSLEFYFISSAYDTKDQPNAQTFGHILKMTRKNTESIDFSTAESISSKSSITPPTAKIRYQDWINNGATFCQKLLLGKDIPRVFTIPFKDFKSADVSPSYKDFLLFFAMNDINKKNIPYDKKIEVITSVLSNDKSSLFIFKNITTPYPPYSSISTEETTEKKWFYLLKLADALAK